MDIIDQPLSLAEINNLREKYGSRFKLTVDVVNGTMVAGCELHADGEEMLIPNGSKHVDIWGGGIDLDQKLVFTNAVLNIRPNQDNDSMDILDPEIRAAFIKSVKTMFAPLWQ